MEMAELYYVSWGKYYRNHYHDLFVSISRSHGMILVSHL